MEPSIPHYMKNPLTYTFTYLLIQRTHLDALQASYLVTFIEYFSFAPPRTISQPISELHIIIYAREDTLETIYSQSLKQPSKNTPIHQVLTPSPKIYHSHHLREYFYIFNTTRGIRHHINYKKSGETPSTNPSDVKNLLKLRTKWGRNLKQKK